MFGSDLHYYAYPDNYKKHAASGGLLKNAHEHPGRDIAKGMTRPFKKSEVLMVQNRGEYLYAACGEAGIRVFDIAFIDDKAFSERITTAPVSPVGQQFYLPTKYATFIAAPTTVAVDPTRTRMAGVLCAGAPPALPDFVARGLQHGFVGGVLPQHQILDDAEQPLPLRVGQHVAQRRCRAGLGH